MTPACPTHRDLVQRVLDETATDDELERYAVEVPDCPACAAAASRAFGVHPAVLRSGGTSRPDEGRAQLLARLEREPWPLRLRRALTADVPARRVREAWAVAALAAAAIVLWSLRPTTEPAAAPEPVAVAAPALPAPERPLPSPRPSPSTESHAEASHEAPSADGPTPRPTSAAPALPPPADDAVADAIDDADAPSWPPPPYVDLRGGAAKSGTPANAVRLQLDGAPALGGSVGLTVTTGVATELGVCVDGPERGVVWRGAVPSGRTVLSRDGLAQRFTFDRPGTWRFLLSTDPDGCADPVHVVPVEVR